ncbi:penicillin-binding transpeptidase domain-containing protein [Streptomyces sp. JJ36]|uniref:penicillin-binding transpeptidase domain-containing protein n=1 Tax=Streptomyces sp. JJ36 TaxID=2736645 RepID=UPI001F211607|nr:penicillin-binding transpeptidase domain-containing protein [Streptomyces sp. JJ36]
MAVIGGVAAIVVGATGFGVYALVGGEEERTPGKENVAAASGGGESPEAVETGPPGAEEVRETAGDFLETWADGDLRQAAAHTDDQTAALEALTAFREEAKVAEVGLNPGAPSGTEVPFRVTAQLAHEDLRQAWAYDGSLEVVRDEQTGDPLVHWEPSVLHPELKEGQSVVTGEAGDPEVETVDRAGDPLTAEDHPTLSAVLADVRKRYADDVEGTPGVRTRIVDAEGKDTGTTLKKLSEGEPGELRTTIDPEVQAAAEAAVAGKAKAAVVAVQPSTGEILAMANSPAQGFNTAFQGSYAPGSTMKVVTAAMLMDKGLASPNAAHPCPKYFTYGHWKFQNDDKFQIQGGTFAQSFARSCNTAFISQAPELENDSLTREAREVFGIGLNWQVGTTTFDGAVPVQKAAQMGASLIGQGGVRMNPLNMASVSATVKSGVFKQPYLVPPEVDGRTLARAPRTMKPAVANGLRQMMRLTAVGGTAARPMAGMSGDFGAKTGSAEVMGQKKPNAWFTAYSGDVAAAAVVPDSGHGGEYAGPIVRKVLDAG